MTKTRLEAFSDGVIAIIITIMVLELKVPHSTDWEVIRPLVPVFLSYLLSFVFLGIYWVNHHHLVHTINGISSGILWANLHLLFWLSLIPFGTDWMGETGFSRTSVIIYAVLADLCGLAYYFLLLAIKKREKDNTGLQQILKMQSRKGIMSNVLYTLAIPAAFIHPYLSCGIFAFVALMWIVPDRNIEKGIEEGDIS
jgi:uncharacterized membrane protein